MPLFLVLLLAALPAAAQSPIPTLLLDEQPVAEPAVAPIGGGFPDAIATDGTNFLIVSTTIVKFISFGQVAMLVDANGHPLLKTSIRLSSGNDFRARVVWSGRVYLVVLGTFDGRTRGVRIDSAGNVLDQQPIEIHPGGGFSGSAERMVVWDGRQFVIATPAGAPPKWIATRVSESGEILQKDIDLGMPLSFAMGARQGATVFVWSDQTGTHSRSMNSAGVPGPVIDVASLRNAPLIVTEDGFLQVVPSAGAIDARHFGVDGQADRASVRISLDATAGLSSVPAGTAYLLVTRSEVEDAARVVHINSYGEVLETPREVPPVPAWSLISATADKSIVAWSKPGDFAGYTPQITLARSLESPDWVQTHRDFVSQLSPRVSWQGMQPLVSWNESGARVQEIGTSTATRLAVDDTYPVAIASSPATTLHLLSAITSSISGVVRKPLYAVVTGHGPLVIDPEPVDTQFVRAVWTGRDFIVVWTRPALESNAVVDVFGARISADGAAVDGPHVIADAQRLLDIAIGASESQVLVVVQAAGVAHGVRLDAFGAWPTDDITTIDDLQFNANPFSVASDGTNFFVTWINRGNREPNDWIGGRLIDQYGHVTTPLTQYSSGGDTKQVLATFWTGSNYLIVWSRGPGQYFAPSELFAARASADGRLLDYPPVRIGAIEGLLTSIARGPGGQLVVAYTRDRRVRTRFVVPARQHSASHR